MTRSDQRGSSQRHVGSWASSPSLFPVPAMRTSSKKSTRLSLRMRASGGFDAVDPPSPHRRRERHANQQTFRRDEAADDLAPRLLLVLDEHVIASGFEHRGGAFDALHLELEPGLRSG